MATSTQPSPQQSGARVLSRAPAPAGTDPLSDDGHGRRGSQDTDYSPSGPGSSTGSIMAGSEMTERLAGMDFPILFEEVSGWRPRRNRRNTLPCMWPIPALKATDTSPQPVLPVRVGEPVAEMLGRFNDATGITIDGQSDELSFEETRERRTRAQKNRRKRVTWASGAKTLPPVAMVPPGSISIPDQRTLDSVTSPDQLELIRTLGVGSFGIVRLCKVKKIPRSFCVKVMSKNQMLDISDGGEGGTTMAQRCVYEKILLKRISDFPFVVSLRHTFQCEHFLYLLMDFVPGGELYRHLKHEGMLPTDSVKFYAAQIVLVFEHLHSLRVAYRDLRLENLVVAQNGYLRVVDFGFATDIQSNAKRYTLLGVPEYLAPEMLKESGHAFEVDWWALGILVYEMMVGQTPFVASTEGEVFRNILSGVLPFPRPFTVRTRPTPYAKRVFKVASAGEPDFITRLLHLNPSKRLGHGGASDVKGHRYLNDMDWVALRAEKLECAFTPELNSEWDYSKFESQSVKATAFSPQRPLTEEEQLEFADF